MLVVTIRVSNRRDIRFSALREIVEDAERPVARLDSEPARAPSPPLGPMTNDEWNRLDLNNAASHMSFLVP
jgi:hypothetical protein